MMTAHCGAQPLQNHRFVRAGWTSQILFDVINEHNKRATDGKAFTMTVIIDDLDRCPKDKIMQMLEATHLLLEQPKAPMVVFLAVDPRIVLAAVDSHLGHGKQGGAMPSEVCVYQVIILLVVARSILLAQRDMLGRSCKSCRGYLVHPFATENGVGCMSVCRLPDLDISTR